MKLFTFVYCLSIVSALVAAPTANEDFVISEIAAATNGVTRFVGSSLEALSTRLANAAQASTNYTDAAANALSQSKADKTKTVVVTETEEGDFWIDLYNNRILKLVEGSNPKTWSVGGTNDYPRLEFIESISNYHAYNSAGQVATFPPLGFTGNETALPSDYMAQFRRVRTITNTLTNVYDVTYADDVDSATNSVSQSFSSRLFQVSQALTNYTDDIKSDLNVDLRRHADMIQAISNESQVVYRLFSSSNVIDEVTNYNSAVNLPTRRLYMLTNTTRSASNYVKIWDESRHHEATLTAATNFAKSAVVDYAAPKGWSATTSGLGSEAPSDTTWISTPTTVFAGGLEYAKFVHTGGEVWVLCGNGMMQFDPDTNAYFRISADDGTDIFSIEKTDAVTVGADADSIRVNHEDIYIYVRVVSATAPTMYWTTNLLSGATVWHSQSELGQYYDVHWTDLSDYDQVGWKLRVSTWLPIDGGIPFPPSMFFKFSYERPGSTKIVNSAVTDVQGGILCTDAVHKVRPVYNNGSVTWEVITE